MILRWDLTLQTEALKGIGVEDVQQSDNKKLSVNEMTVTEPLSQAFGFKYTEDGVVLSNFSNFTILQNLYAVNPFCNLVLV